MCLKMQLCPQSSNTLRAKEINRVNFYVTDISEEYFLSFHVFQCLVILCHRASCGRGWPFFFLHNPIGPNASLLICIKMRCCFFLFPLNILQTHVDFNSPHLLHIWITFIIYNMCQTINNALKIKLNDEKAR